MKHIGTVLLETERLYLRRYTLADAEAVYRNWQSDSEVAKYVTWTHYTNVDDTRKYIEKQIDSYSNLNRYCWCLVPKDINEPIGSIDVCKIDEDADWIALGWCLGKKWWHQGYTSEAALAVINFLFNEVGVNCISAQHDPRNPNSGGVMKKVGMKYNGTFRQCRKVKGQIIDVCEYSILRDEWLKGQIK